MSGSSPSQFSADCRVASPPFGNRLRDELELREDALALKRVFADPVKTSAHQHELASVEELQLRVNLATVHRPIKEETVNRGPIKREFRLPFLIVAFRECQGFGLFIDR